MSWLATRRRLRSPWVIVPILCLLALSLGALWFFHNFERKEIEVHQGTSPAALTNFFLAAERYLLKSGHPATTQKDLTLLSNLPSTQDAILIRRLPGGLSKPIHDALTNWVKAGGHLLLMPNPQSSDHPGYNNILMQLGVKPQESEDDSNCKCPPKAEKESENSGVTDQDTAQEDETAPDENKEDENKDDGYHPHKKIINLSVEGFSIQLETFFPILLEDSLQSAVYRVDGTYHIEYEKEEDKEREDNYKEIKKDGAWLLQYQLGNGKVTVLSEMFLFYNTHLGEHDHAFFLSWLVKDSAQIWLHYGINTDSLLAMLWNKFTLLMISLFILVLLTLWKLQKQSGELMRYQSENRHNIMAHIDASGLYSWRIDKLSSITRSNRKTILHWWAGRKLGSARKDIEVNPMLLAAKSDVTEDDFNKAFQQEISSEQDIIITSRALQKIQTLIHGGE